MGVVYERRGVPVLEDLVGFPQSRLDVAFAKDHGPGLVLKVEREVALGPDLRRIGLQRLLRVEHEGQLLVVDLDELERLLGDVPVDRRYRGDRLAHKAHRVVEHVPEMRGDILRGVVVLPSSGDGAGSVDELMRLVGDDRPDAGQRLRLRHVDAPDARVRMGAP